MIVNSANLRTLFVGFRTEYQNGFSGVQPTWNRIATTVASSTKYNTYGWLAELPDIRKWVGDRVINSLSTSDYTLKNEDYEFTMSVDKNDLDDDNLGIFTPIVRTIGEKAAKFGDGLVWPFLNSGFTTRCYDGQPFFHTDHPVLNKQGDEVSVSNVQAGSGPAWFLLDCSNYIKPVVFQSRKPFEFQRLDADTDEVVFRTRHYLYGLHGRCNVGFSFWQLAFASKAPLTAENYAVLRTAMESQRGDYGKPLGVKAQLLVYPPTLEADARRLLVADTVAEDGVAITNIWKGTAEPVKAQWLA